MTKYPLAWPDGWKRAASRKRANFKQSVQHSWGSGKGQITVDTGTQRILAQLRQFGVREGDAIISTNLVTRLDGLPRSDQKAPADPGAAVYWKLPKDRTHKVMAIDLYDRVADNLAAVAATLEAMRAIERHGGAQILERAFTGFEALPAPAGHEGHRHWWDVMRFPSRSQTLEDVKARYRLMAAELHPDAGGSDAAMAELNGAYAQAQREIGA